MKTKAVDYQQLTTPELEELILDYQNEKSAAEERIEWLSSECAELRAIIDERERESDDEDEE